MFDSGAAGNQAHMRRRSTYARSLGPSTLLALAAFMVALLVASPAQTAPGDVADLALSKADSPDPVGVGSILTYTIEVSNQGPQDATGVTVTDRLPSQIAFVSATAGSGNCERKGRNVTCKVGNLSGDPAKGNAATVTVQVRPSRPGTLDNTASVESVETDPVALNDTATASTRSSSAGLELPRRSLDRDRDPRRRPARRDRRSRRDRRAGRRRLDQRPCGP